MGRFSGKTILLVEEDPTTRVLLTRILSTVGCETVSCLNIQEAFQKLQGWLPNLVFLGVSLSRERELLAFLNWRQNQKILREVPVLVMKKNSEKNTKDQAWLAQGASAILEKPIDTRKVLRTLRILLADQKPLSYVFSEGELPWAEGFIVGQVTELAWNRLKVQSQVRFALGKSVQVSLESYLAKGGSELVCKVENQLVELEEGQFRTVLKVTGQDEVEKKHWESWQKAGVKDAR